MHENIDVIYNIVPLLSTIGEALEYTNQLLSQLQYEEALTLLEDVVVGVVSIASAIKPMQPELSKNEIESLGGILALKMSQVVGSYEMGREADLERQIGQALIVAFENWREEIERVLKAYITAWKAPKRD